MILFILGLCLASLWPKLWRFGNVWVTTRKDFSLPYIIRKLHEGTTCFVESFFVEVFSWKDKHKC